MKLVNTRSVLVNCDCLEVLSRLEDRSLNLVYLDPPWNTESDDFSRFNGKENGYEEFIFKVIQQAYRILKNDGNLILYSIPSLNTNFHNFIRPIFGEENFKAEFIIPIKRPRASNRFQHTHETVIYYSKTQDSQFFPLVEKTEKEIRSLFPMQESDGRYRLEPLVVSGERNMLSFEWKGFTPPLNKIWRYSKEKLDTLDEDGKIFYEKDLAFPKLKRYRDENSTSLIGSVWDDINPYNFNKFFNNSQSEALLERIIKITTKEEDSVCDPFFGSGTTGVVCCNLKRNFIGVEANKEIIVLAYDRIKAINSKVEIENNFDLNPIVWNNYISYGLSTLDIIVEKICKGENERVEYKESYHYSHFHNRKDNDLPDKIMKEIAAFLNSKYGGSIFLGVKDDGTLLGLEKDFEVSGKKSNKDEFELSMISKIKNSFGGIAIDLIDLAFHEIDTKIICEIKINPNNEPIFLNREFYSRNGTQSQNLKNQEFFDLMKKRNKLK